MKTGRKILNLRLDNNISQYELARACQITPGGLSKIETGINTPSAEVLHKLALKLNTSIDYLLDQKAPYPPPYVSPSAAKKNRKWETKRITAEQAQLIEDLNRLGSYWWEAALALPSVNANTIRLIRFLIQRDQMEGAHEADKKIEEHTKGLSRKPQGKKLKKTAARKTKATKRSKKKTAKQRAKKKTKKRR